MSFNSSKPTIVHITDIHTTTIDSPTPSQLHQVLDSEGSYDIPTDLRTHFRNTKSKHRPLPAPCSICIANLQNLLCGGYPFFNLNETNYQLRTGHRETPHRRQPCYKPLQSLARHRTHRSVNPYLPCPTENIYQITQGEI